ncbi:MAG: hypothetical protein DWQ07_13890 [Chloroflexi bacterium]|nr:MAG: hypothetical protein DWQ07_13890 [Chloroflexota bacterium]MBL1197427.1 hypothetical protein [Chloroflexota bacterium]NOH14722.1 hypothetical protein [Chloroflexota bacterium]
MAISKPLVILIFSLFISACSSAAGLSTEGVAATAEVLASTQIAEAAPTEAEELVVFNPTQPPPPTLAPTEPIPTVPPGSPTPDTRLTPNYWRQWPSVPEVNGRTLEVYQSAIAAGRDTQHFSVIGDCQSQPNVFFGIYDTEDRYYFDEDYRYLQETVDYYKGNFGRQSAAVKNGLSVASAFSPLWAPADVCNSGESPIDCELRLNNPSIAIVSLGTNWTAGASQAFEDYLRDIVEHLLDNNVLPIIVTKADNIEGDGSLNLAMAQVAYDYDVPLWNFWPNVQHLPNEGIDPVIKGGYIYLVPEAWDIKSFTGLQALDAIRTAATSP